MKHVAIILPTFNKANEIEEVIRNIKTVFLDSKIFYKLIVVDDGSNDQTNAILESLIDRYDFVLISHKKNEGKGQAIRSGMQFALQEFDIIGYFDADLDLSPQSLVQAVTHMFNSETEILIGSKRHPDSQVEYPIFRRLLSKIFQKLSQFLVQLDISDSQTGLKFFKREILLKVLPYTTLKGFAFDLEILAVARIYGTTAVEFPVEINFTFSSTVRLKSAWRAFADLLIIKRSIKNIGRQNS